MGKLVDPSIMAFLIPSATWKSWNIEPLMDSLPLAEKAFTFCQQDAAPLHNARIITNFFNREFGDNWIGNQSLIRWPARSTDLTPMDFFLWGRVKDLTFRQEHNSRNELSALLQAFNSVSNI